MWPPAKVNSVWSFNDAWLRTSLSEARRQAPRNVVSILDSARELGIRDAQPIDGRSTPNKRLISARFAADWRLVAALARRDPSKYPPAEPGALVVSRSKRPVERGRCAAT